METLMLSVNDIRKIVQKVGLDKLMDEMIARLSKTFQEFDHNKTIILPREGFSFKNVEIQVTPLARLVAKRCALYCDFGAA